MKNKASLGKRKLLAVIVIMLFSAIIGYSPSVHAKGEGIETFGVNHDGYLEMNGEVLYMLVDGERVKATLNGLIEKGDTNQELLMESDLEDKQGMIASIFSFLKPSKAKAAAPKIEYKGAVTYRGSVVGDFRVDGKQAFCFQHSKASPPTGSKYKEATPYDNAKVQRALYYGWGGQENIFKNKNQGIVITSLILDRLYSGGDSGKSLPKYDKLWDLVINGEDIDNSIKFSKNDLSVLVKNNKQISQTTTLKTSKKNSVKVKVPKGITIVNEATGKKVTNGTMRVYGYQKVHLEAGLDVGINYNTGKLESDMALYLPLITKPSTGSYQVLGFGEVFADPNNTTSFKAKFEKRQKNINVQHIDKYSGDLLEKESYTRNIGSTYSFSPKASIAKGKEKFKPVNTNKKTGTLGNKDVTIKFYYNLERSINVNYFDDRTGEKIKESKNYKKVRGEKYAEKHPSIKSGEYTYRYVRTDGNKESGTVGSKNITINYYYDKPLAKIGYEKLQIYTAQWEKGLPVKVLLSKELNYKSSLKEMSDKKITVGLYRGSTKVASKTYTAKELPKKIDMKIPAKYLKVNDKALYTVKFTDFNKNDFKIDFAKTSLATDGYAASEKTIKADAAKDKKLSYKGVVMTEKTPLMGKVFYEQLSIPISQIPRKKTGYGFERKVNLHYENEIGGKIAPAFDFEVPTNMVDSYLTYKKNGNRSLVEMEETKHSSEMKGETSVYDITYELPHINVERHTGHLFNDEQVEKKDKRITYDLVNGGRKFYSPIWSYIGKYDMKLKSPPMGVNLVMVDVQQQLELYAHMYTHMDSETKEYDEVLLKPVYADDPFPNGLPEGWTKEDVEWIKNK
ncbi:hypothetical protein QUF57_01035 [Bacillus pumilus]|uniref:MucBP domain-containing protein n=1 Tax=Bacillus pumilus TaxID=1408 RepID=UPI0025A0BCF2|nr:MucBP domain-containing protein [Bacillus pumilus]MDM5318589.1 hypothetical protein [Bacillus pumilus]